MAFKSFSVINLVIRQPKKDTNTVYYFRDPTNVGWFFSFSLPPSADFSYVNIVSTSGKQDILKQSEANTDLLYFSGLSFRDNNRSEFSRRSLLVHFYHKSLDIYVAFVGTNFPIFAIAFLHA